jgi:excisionase family DNA binding protein
LVKLCVKRAGKATKDIASDIGPVLTVRDRSNYLRVHPSTIYRLLKTGQLSAFRVGSDWRFNVEEIDRWRVEREKKPGVYASELPLLVRDPSVEIRINAGSRSGVIFAKQPAGTVRPTSCTVRLDRHYATIRERLAIWSPSNRMGVRAGSQKEGYRDGFRIGFEVSSTILGVPLRRIAGSADFGGHFLATHDGGG